MSCQAGPHRKAAKSVGRQEDQEESVGKSLYSCNGGKLVGGTSPTGQEAKHTCWSLWLEGS